jgi:hypothetical protein
MNEDTTLNNVDPFFLGWIPVDVGTFFKGLSSSYIFKFIAFAAKFYVYIFFSMISLPSDDEKLSL